MSIFDSTLNYEMPEITGYLITTSLNHEIDLTAEELRLIIENHSDIMQYVISEKMEYNTLPSALRKVSCEQLRSDGGLLLWYRDSSQSTRAYSEIINNSVDNLPPLTLTIEQASIDGLEFSACLAVRCKSVFEAPAESWLKNVKSGTIEEDIEQGAMVFDYYRENAVVMQSATLTSNQAPRRIQELMAILNPE